MMGPTVTIRRSCEGCDYFRGDAVTGRGDCCHERSQRRWILGGKTPSCCPFLQARLKPRAKPSFWTEWEIEELDHCGYHGFKEISVVGMRTWRGNLRGVEEEYDLNVEVAVEHVAGCEWKDVGYYTWNLEVFFSGELAHATFGSRFAVRADAFDDSMAFAKSVVSILGSPVAHLNEALELVGASIRLNSEERQRAI